MTTVFRLADGEDGAKPDLAAIEQQVLELIEAADQGAAVDKVPEKTLLDQIIAFVSTSFDLIRSILIRIIFGVHLLVAIGMVCYVRDESWYFVNSVGVVFIVIEWFVTAFKNGGKDLPWFSPSFFLYIATIIPPTWFLELENIRYKIEALEQIRNASAMASTSTQYMPTTTTSSRPRMRNATADINATLSDYYDGLPIESIPIPLPIPKLPGEIKTILKEASRNFAMYIEVTMTY